MYNNIIEVDIEDAGKRLDVFIADSISEVSRSRIQQLIKDSESILVNNKSSKNSYRLKYDDEVFIKIPEARPLELEAQDITLDIEYEDSNMIVVNKPVGMLTHPTTTEKRNTLVNALLFYCKHDLSGINGVMRPGIVHRLDRDTSGLLMVAKNDFAHKFLSEQIKLRIAKRQYLAVVLGNIKQDFGTINAPIDRHSTQRHKMGVVEGGRNAVTHWKVLERFGSFTLIEATLDTGRTHQIRVHFSHLRHPVAGDPLYGGSSINIKLKGQALQAYKLSFVKPNKDVQVFDNFDKLEEYKICIELEPDKDIQKLIRILDKKEKQ